jgi:hypothetical protein
VTRSWSERARREANKGDLYRDKRKALRNGFRKTSLACLSNSENRTSEKFSQALIRALNTESVIAFPLPIANELKGKRMKSPKLTTPLCRRTLALAHLATQTWPPRESQHNRNVLRAIRTARPGLSVSARPLASGRLRYRQPGQPPRRAWPTKGQGRAGKRMRPAGFAFGPRAPSGRGASTHLREQAPSTPHRQGQGPQHKLYADAPRSNRRRQAARTTPQSFSRPQYLFAQCGAYSRGCPHAQEEDDRKAAQPLANRRRSGASSRSITQLE